MMITRTGALLSVYIAMAAAPNVALAQAASQPAPASAAKADDPLMTPGNDDSALLLRGAKLYQRRCGACHAPDQNRIGPKHRGIYGRAAGSMPGFSYSPALRRLDVIWTAKTLDSWLKDPTAFAPGAAMGFRLSRADERKAVIAYLKSISEPPATAHDSKSGVE